MFWGRTIPAWNMLVEANSGDIRSRALRNAQPHVVTGTLWRGSTPDELRKKMAERHDVEVRNA
jgi:hypothetical protein